MHLAFTIDLSLGATPTKKLNYPIPLLKYVEALKNCRKCLEQAILHYMQLQLRTYLCNPFTH